MPLVTRAGKGSALTAAEMDANLSGLADGSNLNASFYAAPAAFTPVLKFGGAVTGITYTTQVGRYQRVGKLIFFAIEIVLSSKGSATGNATITGLPVAARASSPINAGQFKCQNNSASTAAADPFGLIAAGGTTMDLYLDSSTTTAKSATQETGFGNTSEFRVQGFYETD